MSEELEYIKGNYLESLMTSVEKEAYLVFRVKYHNQPEQWATDNPEVLELLRDGKAEFLEAVCRRILLEHSEEIYFNRCPRCGKLARTPKAKQCPCCFHSWHQAK